MRHHFEGPRSGCYRMQLGVDVDIANSSLRLLAEEAMPLLRDL